MTPKLEMWWWMAVCLHLSYGSETCELKFCSWTGWVMTVRICCPLKHLIRWAKLDWIPTADEATWARRKLLSKQSTKLNATEPTHSICMFLLELRFHLTYTAECCSPQVNVDTEEAVDGNQTDTNLSSHWFRINYIFKKGKVVHPWVSPIIRSVFFK